jgi:hypothetical protein
MTEKINRYGIYKVDHTTFGGKIYLSDFETDYRGKNNTNGSIIAQRIISDRNFDKQCRKNREKVERNKIYGK